MLRVELPPDAGTEGVHHQALSQAAQELQRRGRHCWGTGLVEWESTGGNPFSYASYKVNTPTLRDCAQTLEIAERLGFPS